MGIGHATTATTKPTAKKTVTPAAHSTKSTTHSKTSRTKSKSTSSKSSGKRKKSRASTRNHGQQNIDSARAREIQDALIRGGYMQGEASGQWDASSQHAMEKFQADNGWQTKVIPDSRALIKLGLGPDHQHLLNPESAMTTTPAPGPSAPKDSAGDRAPQN